MPVTLRHAKPKIDLFDFAYSLNPAKNYLFQVLASDIRDLNPGRSLDGGFGELRNYWMFPGQYVGIGRGHGGYARGLKRSRSAPLEGRPAPRSVLPPEVYLMRMQSDFSFIEPVDLAVTTFTLVQIPDPDKTKALEGLIGRVKVGGSMIVEERCEYLDPIAGILEKNFRNVEILYWGFEGCYFPDPDIALDDVLSLSKLEMAMPNTREGHERFYIRATGKFSAPEPMSARPDMVRDGDHLYIVKADLPALHADNDEPLEQFLRRRGLL